MVNVILVFSRHVLENEQTMLTSPRKTPEKQKSESWKNRLCYFKLDSLLILKVFFSDENSDDANKSVFYNS